MKRMNHVALAVVAPALLTFLPVAAGAQPASGAVEFDIQGFVAGRIKAGEHRIVVPPGRYRVTPRYGTHLWLKDLADTLIVADGVEMVCTQTCRALVFENCRNVCFRGLTVDFDPLPFTEGRIVAMAPDKRWVEFEIIEGYPEHELEERIEIFDPATGRLRRETTGWSKKIESLGSHRYRAVKPEWYRFQKDWDTEQVGDILVTNHSFPNGAGRPRRHRDAVLRPETGGCYAVCLQLLRFPGGRVRRQHRTCGARLTAGIRPAIR